MDACWWLANHPLHVAGTHDADDRMRTGDDDQIVVLGLVEDVIERRLDIEDGVGLTAGVEAAAFLPGSAFAGPDGETIDAVYGARAMTRVEL